MFRTPAAFDAFRLQHLILRVYLGLDFTHHFAEKFGLLGSSAYAKVLDSFREMTPAYPAAFVAVAGLCEFGAFVGFTFGLFTRVAAVGTAFYLLVATAMGGHFANGFTWANPGGGWEFPMFWMVATLSFVVSGGGRFSADAWIQPRLPAPLRRLAA